jgi:DNA-binding response OmpR family regulator
MNSVRKVLVVDDDAEVRGLLASAFRQEGLNVDLAGDGREAIDLLSSTQYTVLVLDLVMPDVDGFAVLEHLQSRNGAAPVVIVISGAEEHIVGKLDPRFVHGIVRKPFDTLELASIVVACAEIRGRSAFETMAIAALVAGSPLMAWLSRLP